MGEKEIKGTIFLTSLLRSDGAGHLPSPVELLATLPMPAVTNHTYQVLGIRCLLIGETGFGCHL